MASRYVIGDDGIGAIRGRRLPTTRAPLVIEFGASLRTYFGAARRGFRQRGGGGRRLRLRSMTGYTASSGLLGTCYVVGGDDVYVTKLSADLSTVVFTSYPGAAPPTSAPTASRSMAAVTPTSPAGPPRPPGCWLSTTGAIQARCPERRTLS